MTAVQRYPKHLGKAKPSSTPYWNGNPRDSLEALAVPYAEAISYRNFPSDLWGIEIDGETVYYRDMRRVIKSQTSKGKIVAVKIDRKDQWQRSEAAMMQFASQIPGLKIPKVLGYYEVKSQFSKDIAVIVMEWVAGEPLHQVWETLKEAEKSYIKKQLKVQLALMQTYTKPYIGRVGHQAAYGVFAKFHMKELRGVGPFDSEAEWEKWCSDRLRDVRGRLSLSYWEYRTSLKCKEELKKIEKFFQFIGISKPRKAKEFVLTHGDFAPRNIMVKDGKVTGIIDWEHSGFYPWYIEQGIFAAGIVSMESWWLDVFREIAPRVSYSQAKTLNKMTKWGP